ncbi:MAG: histidinol-phosphatase [candidate division Zixibacteria bacterium HGW-Zixibacteria-1]|nr:MAG: histidinol-phosphatase [candidate division Zixibacteria bacterium HGW-Zixibacteria-1]
MIKSGGHYEYQGCIHIHTTASDGTKDLDEVAEIASSVNLDFILVADHMNLDYRFAAKEGYYNDTLVLIGYEHNDLEDCNHYLLFESDKVLPADMKPQEYVAEGARQGALGIIAHPDEIRPRVGKYPSYPWLAWDAVGFDSIEIWNQMSEWMEKLKPYNKIKMLFSPRRSMQAPTARILQIWDDLNLKKKISGVAGIDVHAYPLKLGPFRVIIFPYKVQYQSLRTHLLLPEKLSPDLAAARKQVYDTVRDCRLFISNFRWGDASGFEFTATDGSKTVASGGSLSDYNECLITVKAPDKATIRLIRNGKLQSETFGTKYEINPKERGLYRVELFKKKRGWIFSNHIRIGI